MYFGNPKSKIVHYQQCHYVSGKDTSEVAMFHTMRQARRRGYRLCYCCSPLGAKSQLTTKASKEFCRKNGITYHLEGEKLQVRSQCSRWYIDLDDRNKLILHHRNTLGDMGAYHIQGFRSGSVQATLRYIASHDRFRSKNPLPEASDQPLPEPPRKGTRHYRADKKKYAEKKRKYEAWRVRELIDELAWA